MECTIPEAFKTQVDRAPDRIAVMTRTCELSYAGLDAWSDAVARQLLNRLGVVHEPVPFFLSQSPLAIAVTLGILKAGKSYVPMDPAWRPQRVADLVHELARISHQ